MPGHPMSIPEPITRRMPFWELPTPALADRGIGIVSGMAMVPFSPAEVEGLRAVCSHVFSAQMRLWHRRNLHCARAGGPPGTHEHRHPIEVLASGTN